MKTTPLLIALLALLAAQAQVTQPTLVATATADESAPYTITERGDHHRVWQQVVYATNEVGEVTSQTNSYTELETGMNVQQPDGSWVEASDEIEITATGGIAQKARHQVIFAGNCNTPVAINLLAADGKRFQSRILGLSYFDSASGQSVLFAELKDSDGRLMPSKNEVIYFDAFTDVKADVRYKNSKAGLEQDIILREQPASPAEYNLNPETTRIQVLTEFFNPPTPEKEQRTIRGLVDETLNFGDQQMKNGRPFAIGDESKAITVTKQWSTLDGRTFLVEEIHYRSVEEQLMALPSRGLASVKDSPDGVLHRVSAQRLLPPVKLAKKTTQPMKVASVPLIGKGLVVDYITASSATNFTFQSDTNYYVSGTVNLSGTTTIEGGAIIKYTNLSSAKLLLSGGGSLVCKTSPYRPAVFTSKDDNTVGETITGSTGTPTNYNGATYLDGPDAYTTYQYLRLSYAGTAINAYSPQEVRHCQFIRCGTAIAAIDDTDLNLRNVLLSMCGTGVNIGGGNSLAGQHVTADQLNKFIDAPYITCTLTNSILTAVTNIGTNVTLVNCVTNSSGNGIYQTVGAASYYLTDNSTNRNAGTTINGSLASDLRKLTTYPPEALTNAISMDTTLNPRAQRDTDTPDVGYHYDPLDYVVNGRSLTNTLVLTNGVALGTYGASSSYGISIGNNGKVVSEGSPTALTWIARYNTVQEQSTTNWSASTVAPQIKMASATAQAEFRFTGWSLPGGAGDHFNDTTDSTTPSSFSHSQFGGGKFTIVPSSVALTNCVWERVNVKLEDNADDGRQWYLFNNLFYGGSLYYRARGDNPVLRAYDNLFDKTIITKGGSSANFTHGNNGYLTNSNRLTPTNSNDKLLTTMNYTNGPLGNYYYPTNGSSGGLTNLFDAGSQNASNAGLYHFTTMINQVKEGSSTVDIGFHYVAVTNSVAFDTDGDGIADYLEDRNGNGTADSGETDWTSYNSPNGLLSGAGLQVFTPLK